MKLPKPIVLRAGAPSRWMPGWFVFAGNSSEHFDTWPQALAYAISLTSEATA